MTASASKLAVKSVNVPDQTQTFGDMGRLEIVQLGAVTGVRGTFEPGFIWAEHVGPTVGADLCQVPHIGYVVSGRSGLRMADGTEREMAAGDFINVPPGHDMWTIGDEPFVVIDIAIASSER